MKNWINLIFYPPQKRLEDTAQFARKIAEVVKAKELGSEHLFQAMLLDKRSTASQILDKVGFHFEEIEDESLLLICVKT